jgi:hypothetical protein
VKNWDDTREIKAKIQVRASSRAMLKKRKEEKRIKKKENQKNAPHFHAN